VFSDDAFDADLNEPIATRIRAIRESRNVPQISRMKVTAPLWDSDKEEEKRDVKREVQTKRVAFAPPPSAPVKSAMDEVEDLTRKMHTLDIGDVAYSGCYTRLVCLAPAAAQAWAPPKSCQLIHTTPASTPLPYLPLPPLPPSSNQSNSTCFFCGGPHVIRTCSTAGEYLRAG
jgi:hypothetical protein